MSNHLKGIVLACLGASSAALFFIPYKILTKELESVWVFVAALYFLSFVLNISFKFLQRSDWQLNKPTLIAGVCFALLSLLGNFAIGKSLAGLHSALTIVVMRSQIFIVIILGYLILKETLNKSLFLGIAIAMLGFLTMNFETITGTKLKNYEFALWGFTAAAAFGSSQIILKKVIDRSHPVTLNILRLGIGSIILAFYPEVFAELFKLSMRQWLLIVMATLFGPTISRNLFLYALKYIPVSEGILYYMLTPAIALLTAGLVLNQWPNALETLGASIMLLGISLPVIAQLRRARKAS